MGRGYLPNRSLVGKPEGKILIKNNDVDGHVARMGRGYLPNRSLVGKPEGKILLGNLRLR
jgi:hypothetical protein